jgi:CHRD domain
MHSLQRLRALAGPSLAATALLACAGSAFGHDSHNRIDARLRGYDETPLALSTAAKGHFSASYDRSSGTISYDLSYHDLEGDVRQAHIHFGRRGVSGGIMVWLCQTTNNPAPAAVATEVPVCPASGKVSGVITSNSVIGPAAQGIDATEFDEFVKAIRSGAGYVNVHSSKYPSGEIRGQLGRDD